VHALNTEKTVRVGWYDSSFNTVDQFGRRSGYAYEYQMKIAGYTGWNYEYINGSWSELMQMLIDGEIDLMSDVSFTKERAEKVLFPELPMGTEDYYLFVAPSNQEITSADYSTLNGKRIGVNKGSIQASFYQDWAQRNGIHAQLVELTTSEAESLQMLTDGKLDAYVTVDAFTDPDCAAPVFQVGSSDFYFAVARGRPDLLGELNSALSRIQNENRYFNQQMTERYLKAADANVQLSADERNWLSGHGAIRVGYQDNYLAFCAADKTTGELTGALKDYLSCAADCLEGVHLDFEAVGYPTVEAAMEDLKKGKIDCVFPANFSGYDGEKLGVVLSPPLMRTDVYAVVRQADMNSFTNRKHVVVAENEGNSNYDSFVLDHYPDWQKVYYETTEDCLKAVSETVADCVLISSYRYNNISRLCEKNHLTTIPTDQELDYCFAVEMGNSELFSILAKAISQVPNSTVNSALSFYITEDAKLSLRDVLADNLVSVLAVTATVMLAMILLMLRSIRSEKKAKQLIAATEIDALTGLYNRDYFFQYANRMRREHPDRTMDAIVLNIEQFHSINALNGRDFGDQVLRVLGYELRVIAEEAGGIAGRFGADRFDIFCRHTEDYQGIFDRLQSKLDAIVAGASIRLRMGVMPGQTGLEPVQMFDRARTACSMARGHYAEHLIVFDEKVRDRELLEQRLLNDLRHALDSYEFEIYYQPKYDIQTDPPKLVSAEALIRWNHPELGMIAPDVFIPLFERNGKIEEVDNFVWNQAARQVAIWRAKFGVTVPVSVNLSRVDVFAPTLERTLDGILRQNDLEHDALKLEITESAYIDNADYLIRIVQGLRRKGYTLEMDDFGTGYSSLNMLSTMPIDVLKMDRMFIQNMEHDSKSLHLVSHILGIAKSLNVPVIAEGVETESQLLLLKKLGCTVVQGYYFSCPLHPADFEAQILQKLTDSTQ
jgi:diguanylate cyclase (GGDEF)-like protein